MVSTPETARAFLYRAGVRLAGTIVACDAAAGGDLVFLSHAAVLGARGRRALPRVGSRRQILATAGTLALLGPLGERLRAQALLAPYGRPFTLGDLRLEIFPSGFLPGAASLACERDGRRLVYAGPVGDGCELRAADALCLDARLAFPDGGFPPRLEAETALVRLVRDRTTGGAPLLFIEPLALAPTIALLLGAAGVPLRAHRAILEAVAAFRRADPQGPYSTLPALPAVQRFAGRLAEDEVLLWPAEARPPRQGARGQSAPRPRVFVSPRAGRVPGVEGAQHLRFPFGADLPALVRYVEATGAAEVALLGAPDETLAELLRAQGRAAYRIGPPRQIDLFGGA
jgi:hypothetical protein